MTYKESIDYIHSLHRFGRKPELTRMKMLLDKLGNPQKNLKFIHIAGTNGKGSTTTMIGNILDSAGYKTGIYTSPFIRTFRERMCIGSKMISEEELAEITEIVKHYADILSKEYDSPREFEVVTAIAMLYFCKQNCDIVALEVGLGGRFDATNAIDSPLASVICPIDFDHTSLLGNTYYDIAKEKCGIIKENSLVISAPNQQIDARNVIERTCSEKNSILTIPQPQQIKIINQTIDYTEFLYHGIKFKTHLLGEHQLQNAITAIDTILCVGANNKLNVRIRDIQNGIEKTRMAARIEIINKNPLIIIDGSHNVHGVKALDKTLKFIGSYLAKKMKKAEWEINITAIVGMMKDKDCSQAIDIILPYCKNIIVTAPDIPRALAPIDMKKLAKNYSDNIIVANTSGEAFIQAQKTKSDIILIFGSLYLASEIRNFLELE